jgi:hypothetical protein
MIEDIQAYCSLGLYLICLEDYNGYI